MQECSTRTITTGRTTTTTMVSVPETNLFTQTGKSKNNRDIAINHLELSKHNQTVQKHPSNKNIKDVIVSYDDVISLKNLLAAYYEATKGKTNRSRYQGYSRNLGLNLQKLHKKLKTNTYSIGKPTEFNLYCISGQKVRKISAPSLEDLIVQHAIYRKIYDIFDKSFIFDSYGCRKYKGTHRAADRCQCFIRKSPADSWYLQIDIHKYYYSINREILRTILNRKPIDSKVIDLLLKQFSNNPTCVGLNVGALLSQLMGLIYLDYFDHYVKRVLKVKHYIRYVDDAVFIGLTKQQCIELKEKIISFLGSKLDLTLSKFKIAPIKSGVNFTGYITYQNTRYVRKRSLKVFNRNLNKRKFKSIQSSLAHVKNTSNYKAYMTKIIRRYDLNLIDKFDSKFRSKLIHFYLENSIRNKYVL